ncbi:hypothetical protein C0585_08075 [Candidatus Woesearchaeota archaeon]|nr:MAG: hypothetical protein C0585_08075 [Candidatus Woesearchaeota archaeon]
MSFHNKIKQIENSRFELDEKVNLVLVLAGVKPSTELGLYELDDFSNFDYDIKKDTMRFKPSYENHLRSEVSNLLEELELFYDISEKKEIGFPEFFDMETRTISPMVESIFINVAKTKNNLNYLLHAKKDPLSKSHHRRYGLAVGYPKTAILAFDGVLEKEYNLEIEDKVLNFFADFFVFSKKYMEDELKVSRLWKDTIERLSPNLYSEVKDYAA